MYYTESRSQCKRVVDKRYWHYMASKDVERERERVCTELIWKCTKHFSGHFGRFRISVSCDDAVGAPCQVYIAEKGCAKKVGELASGAAKAMSRSQASSLHIDVFFKELEVAKSFRSLAVVWAVFSAITSLLVPSCLFVLFCFVSNERRRETVSISPTWRISSTRRHKRQEERVFFGVKNNNNSTAVGDWLKNAPIPSIKISSLSFTVSARNIFSFPVWTDLLNRAGLPTACFVLFFVFFFSSSYGAWHLRGIHFVDAIGRYLRGHFLCRQKETDEPRPIVANPPQLGVLENKEQEER